MVKIRYFLSSSLRTIPIKRIIHKLGRVRRATTDWFNYLLKLDSIDVQRNLLVGIEKLIHLNHDLYNSLTRSYTRAELAAERKDICLKYNHLIRGYRQTRSDFHFLLKLLNGGRRIQKP